MADSTGLIETWLPQAGNELAALQAADGGWSYVAGQASATEPTALALLALTAIQPATFRASSAIEWLLARQRGDGTFTAWPVSEEPSWVTPLAALALLHQGRTDASGPAAQAVLDMPAYTIDALLASGIYGYNTELRGWPWTAGDFSFVEPTCLAMIFLKKAGYRDHPRAREAADMLRNRALAGGGWNYGEPMVWGGGLYPAASSTAMALAALADEQDDVTAAGLNWLLAQRGAIGSLPSLGWAAVALNVLGRLDGAWAGDVVATWSATPPQRRGPLETSLCMLGAISLASPGNHPLGVNS